MDPLSGYLRTPGLSACAHTSKCVRTHASGTIGKCRKESRRDLAAADAWGALLRVHAALVPLLDRELQAKHHLPLAWYDVLLELNYGPDRRLRMSELGERVTLSRTRVSRLVDEMTAAGLVGREANPDDRRSAYAVLTPKGRTPCFGRPRRPTWPASTKSSGPP